MRIKRTTKKIITAVALLLVGIMAVSAFGFATNGFQERDPQKWSVRVRNEDNLLDNAAYALAVGVENTGSGVTVTVKEDGSFVIDGTNKGTDDIEIELADLSLNAGEYTFTSGYKAAGTYTAYLKYQTTGGTYIADFGGENGTFILSANTTGKVYLVIAPDYEFRNVKMTPVIVTGDEAGDFYK